MALSRPQTKTHLMDKSLNEIAKLVEGTVIGRGDVRITGLSGLEDAKSGDLSFLGNPRFESLMATTQAAAVLVPESFGDNGFPVIRVGHPYQAFATVLKLYEKETLHHPVGVHPTSAISEGASLGKNVGIDAFVRLEEGCEIGDNVVLYSGVYVGRGSTIGQGTIVYPNVTIREGVRIGARCIIHSNVSLGSDGFGFTEADGAHVKIPQVGTVQIGDDVEIGSNSAIDRSTMGPTVIGNGTKIDNLVQIAHNVTIGEHCTISSGTGIAGSTKIGNNVTMAGRVGIRGHLEIGDNVVVGGGTGIVSSVPAGSVIMGTPHQDINLARRIWISLPLLPKALRRLRMLEARIDKLEE